MGDMTSDDLLDETYDRLRATGPEFEGWLSNHGPMAVVGHLAVPAPRARLSCPTAQSLTGRLPQIRQVTIDQLVASSSG